MSMTIANRFKYFKDINESLKRKYGTQEDFSYSEMASAIDNIPSGGGGIPISGDSDTPIFFGINDDGVYMCTTEAEATAVAFGREGMLVYVESVY